MLAAAGCDPLNAKVDPVPAIDTLLSPAAKQVELCKNNKLSDEALTALSRCAPSSKYVLCFMYRAHTCVCALTHARQFHWLFVMVITILCAKQCW